MDIQQHSFRRADGSVITIRSTCGAGVSVVEVFDGEEPMPEQPKDAQAAGGAS